jgi:hypothetical protein
MTCPHCKAAISGSDLGKIMRSANSEAQKQAARENGKKGGRPKKIVKIVSFSA